MSWRVEVWDRTTARARAALVWSVYDAVFADADNEQTWSEQVFERHADREGFELVVALEAERPLGFAYGYLGQRGQYWSDRVADALPEPVGDDWVGGHLELVELAVLEDHRGQGIGRRLHDRLVADTCADRALLSTDAQESPAVRLYRSAGWRPLGLLAPDVQIMGLDLRERPAPCPTA